VLDVRRIRNDPDEVRKALARRHDGSDADVDRVLDLDRRRREAVAERDALRAEVKAISQEVGRLRREGAVEDAERRAAQSARVGERVAERDREVDALDGELRDLLLRVPNTPAPEAPDGEGEADNVVLRTVGHDPDAYGECPTGRSPPASACSTSSGRPRSRGRCS
jgi:seryl-tRNA synthetase